MRKVFVSGCYEILHGGHIQFFKDARALGDHLTVSFASADVLWQHKRRRSSIPDDHKRAVLESLSMVDEVVIGRGTEVGLDFKADFLRCRPNILAVTTDDRYGERKRALCKEAGCEYVVLEKTPPRFTPVSTTQIVKCIRAPEEAPLRVDFAGGWLDVPRFSRPGGYIVNCAISPMVSLLRWPYERNSGLGGSGAWALLSGKEGVQTEIELGVGWQDPAVIAESGCCVWRSGARPVLEFKRHGDFLLGRMALFWTGHDHDTAALADRERDYDGIAAAGRTGRDAVLDGSVEGLAEAVRQSYAVQRAEGMDPLPGFGADTEDAPIGALAAKYCGSGFGGYALYLFPDEASRSGALRIPEIRAIEPFTR